MFSKDGKLVAVIESETEVALRAVPSLQRVGTPQAIGWPLGFVPDDSAFVSIQWPSNSTAAEVGWWRVPDFQPLRRLKLPEVNGLMKRYVLSPDRRTLATPGAAGEVRIWNLAGAGELTGRLSLGDVGTVTELAFSPDGRWLAIAFRHAVAGYLWDMNSAHAARALPGLGGMCIRFLRDGKTFFGSRPQALALWNTETGREIAPLLGRWGGVNTMDLSPDDKTLAFPARGAVRLWNVVTRREVGRLVMPFNSDRVAFAPDGNELLIMENRPEGPDTLVKRAPSFAETDAAP
jgi:hypothetical protein